MSCSTLSLSSLLAQRPSPGFVVGMLFAAQKRHKDFASVFHRVIEVHDLSGRGETKPSHVGQALGSVDQQDDLQGQCQTAADSVLAQGGTKLFDGTKTGNVGGGFIVT